MKIAVYAGSFDPFTTGHLYVLEEAANLFDLVIVTVVQNAAKNSFLTLEERKKFIEHSIEGMDNVEVRCIKENRLTARVAVDLGAQFLVRGVRNNSDYIAESEMAEVNKEISGISTIFIPSPPSLKNVSSTNFKVLTKYGENAGKYIPEKTRKEILEIAKTRL